MFCLGHLNVTKDTNKNKNMDYGKLKEFLLAVSTIVVGVLVANQVQSYIDKNKTTI